MKVRNQNIDAIKGILILLVVIGHFMLGGLQSSFLKYFIYCFHMPVFIFVSGYLLPYPKWKQTSMIQIVGSYRYRVIFPWMIAVAIFCFLNIGIHHAQENPLWILLRHYVKPFFHLWYIPSFLLFVLLSRAFILKVNRHLGLAIAILVSCSFYAINENGILENGTGVFSTLFTTFRMQYWMFFVFGGYCKGFSIKWPSYVWYAIFILYVSVVIFHWFNPSLVGKVLIFIPLNGWMMMVIPQLWEHQQFSPPRWLVWCGEQTMGIYLWHMIPILLIKHNAALFPPMAYYVTIIISLFVLFYFLHWASRIPFFKTWFLGIKT